MRVAPDRVISTVDPDPPHAHKTVYRRQDGFKAHLAIEPDTGVITDCAVTKAAGAGSHDAVVGLGLLDDEPEPVTVLGDSADGTGDARAALADAGHCEVIKPSPLRPAVTGEFTLGRLTGPRVQLNATHPQVLAIKQTQDLAHTQAAEPHLPMTRRASSSSNHG